jgi:Ca-activated chloride channel family protein
MNFSNFASPWWFLVLTVVAALAISYVLIQRRSKKHVLRFANYDLLSNVVPKQRNWWRHVPAALMIVSLALLTVALAGPTGETKVPRNRATVILVIDVSLSMESTDVAPTRIQAAQEAATKFANELPAGINLGLISFSGSAVTLVTPTTNRAPVISSIANLKLAEATATGEGIFAALQNIQNFAQVVSGADGPPPARIVLMSDGKENVPMDLDSARGAYTAATEAKKESVPISTISFGTDNGTISLDGTDYPVPVDDDSLRKVARLSGGDFYKATTGDQLKKIYETLNNQIGYETRQADNSKPWMMLGTLIALLAAGGSLLLNQRIP